MFEPFRNFPQKDNHMKIVSLPKPSFITARTKSELMSKISASGAYEQVFGSMNGGKGRYSCLKLLRGNQVRVYNIHKVRGKMSPDHKKVIREPHWIGYVYTFNKDAFSGFRKFELNQKTRNFVLKISI